MLYGNNGYAVIYDANGGTGAPAEQVKKEGTNLTLSSTVPKRTGYKFLGWSEYADNESYKFLKGATYKEDRGIKLYATWIQTTESEIIDTITGDSILSIVKSKGLVSGFYNFVVKDETYKVHVFVKEGNCTYGGEGETLIFGDNIANNSMMILKCNGELTISEGSILTPYTTPKGMFVYSSGTITNNGEISISLKGSTATGQNVYLWKNSTGDKEYEMVPKIGAEGGKKASVGNSAGAKSNGKPGNDGVNRETGGGGSGAVFSNYQAISSKIGGAGTSYKGGNGSDSVEGTIASGNKQGGGLLIMCSKIFVNHGIVSANGGNGIKGNATNTSSGSSGGGSINIFCNQFNYSSESSITAKGGVSYKSTYVRPGGTGGGGYISIGTIESGKFEELYGQAGTITFP